MAKKELGINPWLNIWIRPRDTIAKIVKFNPKFRFIILSFLYGLPLLFHTAQNMDLAGKFTTIGIVVASVILATFVGMLGITIGAALVYWTGKWIGGKSSFLPVRAAVSWANVPNALVVLVWVGLIVFFKDKIFTAGFQNATYAGDQLIIFASAVIVQAVLSIWSFVILVKSIGEVQGFSAWKGILNVLIPFFIVGVLFYLLMWLISIGTGMAGSTM